MQEAGRQIRAYFPKRVFVFSRTVRGSDQQGLSFGQGERERERCATRVGGDDDFQKGSSNLVQ